MIIEWIKSHQKLTFTICGGLILLLLPLLFLQGKSQLQTGKVKEIVEVALDRPEDSFTLSGTSIDQDGWKLMRLTSTRENDKGNTAFIIVYQDEEEVTLKVGPGTYFSRESMQNAGVPPEIQTQIQGAM